MSYRNLLSDNKKNYQDLKIDALDCDVINTDLIGSGIIVAEEINPPIGNDLIMDTIPISRSNWISLAAGSMGEVNTASNVGAGQGLFKQKAGTDLEFYSISGNDINVNLVGDDVELSVNKQYCYISLDNAIDVVNGFDSNLSLVSSGYTTEGVLIELGENVTTAGVTVSASSVSTVYDVKIGNLNTFDRNTGRLSLPVGIYDISASVVLNRISGSGTRVFYLTFGINGVASTNNVCAASQIDGQDLCYIGCNGIIELLSPADFSLFIGQIHLAGTTVQDMEIFSIKIVVNKY